MNVGFITRRAMDKWVGKVALVTGASVGIGRAIAESLVRSGMKVIGCSRSLDTLREVAAKVNASGPGEMVPVRCDITSESEILEMFRKIEEKFGALHVCVNNAGLAHDAPLLSGSTEQWKYMLEVNVVGLSICTREAVKVMEKHGIDGHIVHIGSMSGHRIMANKPSSHFNAATKFAVKALAEGLRQEFRAKKSKIRVTHISPGVVETEFDCRMFPNDQERAKATYTEIEALQPEDIGDAVLYTLSAPARVDINDVLVRPTEQQA